MSWRTGLNAGLITKANVCLLLLGGASVVLYRVSLRANGAADIGWFIKVAFAQSAIYLLAAWIVLRASSSRRTFLIVVVLAVLFRLSILFAPPYLSDDIYRYVWDGRVQSAGVNPYRHVPADPVLAHLRDEAIYPKINRRDYAHTIYPPVAEAIFFLTTRLSETVTWMKITMLGFELVALWAIAQLLTSFGLPRERLLLYSWHPLIIWEFAGSGHVDAIAIALITVALLAHYRHAEVVSAFALACATLIKLFPLVLFPAIYKRGSWKIPLVFAATVIVAYLPYLSVGPKAVLGFLPGYAKEQGLVTGEQFYLLHLARKLVGTDVPSVAFVIFAILVIGTIVGWAIFRTTSREANLKTAMLLATATTVLFAPHYSWYFAWLVPFLCFTPSVTVLYLTTACFILYGTWLGDAPAQMFALNSYLYLPFLLIAGIEFAWRHFGFHPGPLTHFESIRPEAGDR